MFYFKFVFSPFSYFERDSSTHSSLMWLQKVASTKQVSFDPFEASISRLVQPKDNWNVTATAVKSPISKSDLNSNCVLFTTKLMIPAWCKSKLKTTLHAIGFKLQLDLKSFCSNQIHLQRESTSGAFVFQNYIFLQEHKSCVLHMLILRLVSFVYLALNYSFKTSS